MVYIKTEIVLEHEFGQRKIFGLKRIMSHCIDIEIRCFYSLKYNSIQTFLPDYLNDSRFVNRKLPNKKRKRRMRLSDIVFIHTPAKKLCKHLLYFAA